MKKRIVIKLGGSSLQNPNILSELANLILGCKREYDVTVVHGGGPAINAELTSRGIQWQFIRGQRQTTPQMMSVIEDVLANKINSLVVGELRSKDIHAVGLSGASQRTLFCTQLNVELMQVGTIEQVNPALIEKALSENQVPVLAPIGIGEAGEKYNINADWAACKVAAALKAETLLFLTDQDGILDSNSKVVPTLNPALVEKMIQEGTISGGMFTKVSAMLSALSDGVGQIAVLNATTASEFLSDKQKGSRLIKSDLIEAGLC